jgi:hypothetical protein
MAPLSRQRIRPRDCRANIDPDAERLISGTVPKVGATYHCARKAPGYLLHAVTVFVPTFDYAHSSFAGVTRAFGHSSVRVSHAAQEESAGTSAQSTGARALTTRPPQRDVRLGIRRHRRAGAACRLDGGTRIHDQERLIKGRDRLSRAARKCAPAAINSRCSCCATPTDWPGRSRPRSGSDVTADQPSEYDRADS